MSLSQQRSYGSPAAFRRALTDRLRTKAETSRWTLSQLQRQIAYDRLLERLYLHDNAWIVKGATALLARDIGVRGSLDVDVYREALREVAEAELRQAATQDIGDWFRFEIAVALPVVEGTSGVRIPVRAYVGATVWAEFHIDLVGSDLRMTGEPEVVPPLVRIVMPDIEQHGYYAYPLVDHVADKVCAIPEPHGEAGHPSTRYRDLVDLVAIGTAASVEAEAQLSAVGSEAKRRDLALPRRFDVPDRALWEPGYAAEAGRSLLPIALTLDEALTVVRPFLDPLLDSTAAGAWDPTRGTWST
ncbi:MAG: nucleotidyl transferase AbiEii/AbiGii toxin family protein [Actinomycetota bacterium]